MPRRRSTVIHVRPEIRRRVHRRRFFRRLALVLVGAAILTGTIWQYEETMRPQPVPNLPPPQRPQRLSLSQSPALSAPPATAARPISTTPLPVVQPIRPTPLSVPLPIPRPSAAPRPGPVQPLLSAPAPAITAPIPTPPAPEAPVAAAQRTSILSWFESIFPLMVRTFEERIAAALAAAKNQGTTIKYSEQEFQQAVVRQLQARSLQQLQDLQVSFHPEGILGAGVFQLGPLPVPFSFQANIDVVEGRPHAALGALNAGGIQIPDALLKALESRVNEAIDRDRLPLEIKWFRVEEHHILISAELV